MASPQRRGFSRRSAGWSDLSRPRARHRDCKQYHATDRNVNFKVTQMAIAHTAIRNFAVDSVTIAVLGLFAVLVQAPGNATAKAIRKDAELQRLLRGPQGPVKLSGPPAAAPPAQDFTSQKGE